MNSRPLPRYFMPWFFVTALVLLLATSTLLRAQTQSTATQSTTLPSNSQQPAISNPTPTTSNSAKPSAAIPAPKPLAKKPASKAKPAANTDSTVTQSPVSAPTIASPVADQLAPATTPATPPAPPQDNMGAATAPTQPILKVFQFPADRIPRIDGSDDDWKMVPDSYAITLADMHDDEHLHTAPDPKDLDVKVKVGWVKGLNRLYFLYEAYKNYWDFADPGLHNDTFELVVDGDRSGGPLIPRFRNNTDQDAWDAHFSMNGVQAQNYHIFTPAEGKDWAMEWGCQPWVKQLPYANHAQSYKFRPGQSGKYILEFYITPFDYAGCEGPQRAVESLLTENKLIGLSWAVINYEGTPDGKNNGFWNLSTEHKMYGISTYLRSFRLMPLEPQFRKTIDAQWSFKVLDMSRRLVAFQDESVGQITSWKWSFGDNTDSADQNPIHQYKDAGKYVVVLTVTGPGGTSRLSKVWDVIVR